MALALVATAACNNKRVARIDPASVTDLSGRWNDADSRLVANELVSQSLNAPWAKRYATRTAAARRRSSSAASATAPWSTSPWARSRASWSARW
jgi:hypothetical protein